MHRNLLQFFISFVLFCFEHYLVANLGVGEQLAKNRKRNQTQNISGYHLTSVADL